MRIFFIIIAIVVFGSCSNTVEQKNIIKENTETKDTIVKENKTPDIVVSPYEIMLNEYIERTQKYSELAQKVKKGNVSALEECTALSIKIKAIESELMESAVKMTEVQRNKLIQSYNAYAKTISELEKTNQ